MSSYQSYSSGMGERILNIGEFRGIDQSRGDHGADYGTSPDAVNFISRYGKLYTAGGTALYGAPAGLDDDCQGRLCQAFFRDSKGQDTTKLLMFINGCIYASDADASEWTLIGSGFHSDNWDIVNYRDGVSDWAIMTNGVDNVQYWDGWSSSVSMLLNAEENFDEEYDSDGNSATDNDASIEETPEDVKPIPDIEVELGSSVALSIYNFPDYSENGSWYIDLVSDNACVSISPTTITSSDENIVIAGESIGNAVITAKMLSYMNSSNGGYYSEHEITLNVSVVSLATFIGISYSEYEGEWDASIDPSYSAGHIQVGKNLQLKSKILPDTCTESFVWESSDESVAIVDGQGKVTAISNGVCEILLKPSNRSGEATPVGTFTLACYSPGIISDSDVYTQRSLYSFSGTSYVTAELCAIRNSANESEPVVEMEKMGSKTMRVGFSTTDKSGTTIYRRYSAAFSFVSLMWYMPHDILSLKLHIKLTNPTDVVLGYGSFNGGNMPLIPELYDKTIASKENVVTIRAGSEAVVDVTKAFRQFLELRQETENYINVPSGILFYDTGSLANVGLYTVNTVEYIKAEVVFGIENTENDNDTMIVEPSPIQQGNDTLIFSQIALLRERLWGAVSPAYPDRIYWSNTFDPNDWELNWEDSSNVGGGFIDIATFDGTRIRSILTAFDEVLVFKDKSIHRITGSSPGEFSVATVYSSEGTLAPRSIVYTGDRVYFLSIDGLCVYNGVTAAPLSASGDRKLRDIWKRINESTISTACAVLKDNIIYLSVPLDGSIINTHVIEYNLYDGTYSVLALPGVDDWLLMREGQKETLLFLNGNGVYQYDSGYTFAGEPINASWISPEISGSSMSARKTTGRIYMRIEAQSLDISKQPYIKLTMSNGVKSREKLIRLNNGMNDIRKRVKIRGRTFRFKIENVDGNPITIHRGVEIYTEEDFD